MKGFALSSQIKLYFQSIIMIPSRYNFSGFVLDTRERTLCKNGETLKLKNRTFQILRMLIENAGKLITKDEFFERIWQDSFVEENNLTVAVAEIRKTLGETKDNKFIKTVPKKGYRFVAEVQESSVETKDIGEDYSRTETEDISVKKDETFAEPERSFLAWIASRKVLASIVFVLIIFTISAFWWDSKSNFPSNTEPLKSIAVLPFSSDRKSPDSEVFAEKLTQNLIYNLGRSTDVRVSAYEAIRLFDYPEPDLEKIGRELKIEGAVTGKIINREGNTEIEIKLNDLRGGKTVYTKSYSLKPQDLAQSQYLISRDIARELGRNKEVKDFASTTNFEAYQAYLQARHHLGKHSSEDYEKAVEFFTNAALKDSSFADAHSGLATAHIFQGLSLYANLGLSASRKSFPAAKASALKALELKKNSDEALAALAFVNYHYEYDWKNAEANFRKAVEINPNNVLARRWLGDFLHKTGRFDEGFAEQQKALTLEPNSWRILGEIAWGNYLAHRFDKAANYAEKAQYISKKNASDLYNFSEIYEAKGDYAEAAALWKEAMTIEAANRKWIANIEKSFRKEGHEGFVRAKAEWLEDLIEKDYVYPTDLAKCYAALGEKEKAIEWLEKGVEERVPDILSIKYTPGFDSIKTDARFQAILTKMNFPK